jgi:hypothetical protein
MGIYYRPLEEITVVQPDFSGGILTLYSYTRLKDSGWAFLDEIPFEDIFFDGEDWQAWLDSNFPPTILEGEIWPSQDSGLIAIEGDWIRTSAYLIPSSIASTIPGLEVAWTVSGIATYELQEAKPKILPYYPPATGRAIIDGVDCQLFGGFPGNPTGVDFILRVAVQNDYWSGVRFLPGWTWLLSDADEAVKDLPFTQNGVDVYMTCTRLEWEAFSNKDPVVYASEKMTALGIPWEYYGSGYSIELLAESQAFPYHWPEKFGLKRKKKTAKGIVVPPPLISEGKISIGKFAWAERSIFL